MEQWTTLSPWRLLPFVVTLITVTLCMMSWEIAGGQPIFYAEGVNGSLHFAPECEPLAKKLFRVKAGQDMTQVNFKQFSYAKIWLDICTTCVNDRVTPPVCNDLFTRLHPEVK